MKDFFNPRLKKTIRPKKKKVTIFYNPSKKRTVIFKIGTGIFFLTFVVVSYFYFPFLKELASFQFFKLTYRYEIVKRIGYITPAPAAPTPTLPPVPDSAFSIVIPKIDAAAKVIANTDAGNSKVYGEVIKEGVAHAASSGFPGSGKTIYLFAHSTNTSWNVVRYNAVFFLLNNLELGDEILVVYNNKAYRYFVADKKVVGANETSYLMNYQDGETLILQTCWPPGTIMKRLLVFAKPE